MHINFMSTPTLDSTSKERAAPPAGKEAGIPSGTSFADLFMDMSEGPAETEGPSEEMQAETSDALDLPEDAKMDGADIDHIEEPHIEILTPSAGKVPRSDGANQAPASNREKTDLAPARATPPEPGSGAPVDMSKGAPPEAPEPQTHAADLPPDTAPNAGLIPDTEPNAGLIPDTEPNAGLIPATEPNAGLIPDTEPRHAGATAAIPTGERAVIPPQWADSRAVEPTRTPRRAARWAAEQPAFARAVESPVSTGETKERGDKAGRAEQPVLDIATPKTPLSHPVSIVPSRAPMPQAVALPEPEVALPFEPGPAGREILPPLPGRAEQPSMAVGPAPAELGLHRADSVRTAAAQAVEIFVRQPNKPVEITLNPQELGKVRMALSTSEAGVTVSILSERPETMELMRRNIDELAREFRSLGYENTDFQFGEETGDSNPHLHEAEAFVVAEEPTLESAAIPRPAVSGLDLRL